MLSTPHALRRAFAAIAAAILAAGLATAAAPSPATAEPDAPLPTSETGLWIVHLAEPSLAARQAPAGTVDPSSVSAQAYLDTLASQQARVTDALREQLGRTVEVAHSYRNVLNAIVIEAAPDEVAGIAAVPGVASVEPDQVFTLTSDVSHDLVGSAAIWDGETGPELPTRGEGVVVGILDSGINPFHPSFAATDGEGYTHANPYGRFLGVCDPAHPNHDPICNDKLVGAWSFVAGNSARDANGHGSHTASTAAGNRHDAVLHYGEQSFTRTVQGVAPRANLVAYRVCVTTCPVSSILAGINQAIADGVDVLNYSISGTDNPWVDSVSRAFLEAFGAGIFVSTSAGNSGPGAGTVAHTGPWNAATAATTTDRTFAKPLSVLGPAPVPPALAEIGGWPGFGPGNADPIEASLRYSGQVGNATGCNAFPAGGFAGTVALIPLGTCNPDVKVRNAANAGALAAVLFERQPGPPVFLSGLEATTIPAVSVDQATGEALQALVTGTTAPVPVRFGADGETTPARDGADADAVIWFSSRGPSDFNVLAPTFAAPGVNVLAAWRDRAGNAVQYDIIRGTSMASPHTAGAGALLTALHPDWSPAQIRAALSATADPDGVRVGDGTAADPLETGAGRIDLAAAGRVGVVLDESYQDMLAANPATGGDPRTLNVPHLVNRQCVVVCQFTREVTSAADATASYTATVAAPAGMVATVEPASFTLAPGASRSLTITVDVTGSSGGDWVFADLRLSTSDTHAGGAAIAGAHYPVAVIPVAPAIRVEPASVEASQKPDRTANRTVTIRNQGNGPLTWALAGGPGCDTLADVPWLSATVTGGTVAAGGTAQTRLTLDSTGQPPGVLTATLCVSSNDPARPVVELPVTLTVLDLPTGVVTPAELAVSQPAGTITGTPLTIGNTGTAALDWTIGEAPVQTDGAALAALDPERRALLRDGVLLVPNTGLPGVAAFDPEDGELLDPAFITYPEPLGTTTHIILNAAQDGFLVSSQSENVVHAFDLEGQYQGVFAPVGGGDTSIMGNIRGLTISPWGTLLVTSANGNKVVEFDAGGNLLGNFIEPQAGGLGGPWHVLFREDDVLVSDSGGDILRYDHTGAPLSVWNDQINFPQQLYRQADGNILSAAFSAPAGVWEFSPEGAQVGRYSAVGQNRGAYPLANGNILTSNSNGVHEIDRGTSLIETELTGGGVRMISEIQRNQPCDEPGDVSWLSVSDDAGSTGAGESSEVTVLVDSTGLAPGVHEAHVCVNTNDPDSPVIGVPVSVTVTDQVCGRTITADHTGPVVVAAGLTCLAHGSSVTGPVTVVAGGSLHATGTVVDGPLTANGATDVELLGSVVVGPVFLRGASGLVVLSGNHVTGPVSLTGNHTAPAPIVVAGNTVTGRLACTDNDPPPVNDGRPNTVGGPRSGQCAGL